MATTGSAFSDDAIEAAEALIDRLLPLGDVSSKPMFGGYGIFESGKMFALVDSRGAVFLKVVDANRAKFERAGSVQHGRMPYYQVPEDVLEDNDRFLVWSQEAIMLSKI